MVRILLYSTVPVVSEGFTVLLAPVPEFDLMTVCSTEQQLVQAMGTSEPDLVLIDLGEETPLDRLLELRREYSPHSRVVLWVQSISPELAYQTMRMGVRGILRKSLGAEVIVKCLQRVSEGECWFEEALTASFVDIRTVRLSGRESQLLNLVSHGYKNKEIAAALSIAEPTVKVYLSRLFRKVGAKDRLELALYGLRSAISGHVSAFSGAAAGARRPPVLIAADVGRRSRLGPQPVAMRSIA
jgi:two-component system, NarL family, nitrate/nitrite response regulator NarL